MVFASSLHRDCVVYLKCITICNVSLIILFSTSSGVSRYFISFSESFGRRPYLPSAFPLLLFFLINEVEIYGPSQFDLRVRFDTSPRSPLDLPSTMAFDNGVPPDSPFLTPGAPDESQLLEPPQQKLELQKSVATPRIVHYIWANIFKQKTINYVFLIIKNMKIKVAKYRLLCIFPLRPRTIT